MRGRGTEPCLAQAAKTSFVRPCKVHARRVLISARGINTRKQPPTICYSLLVDKFDVPRKLFLDNPFHMASTGKRRGHDDETFSSLMSKKRKSTDTSTQPEVLQPGSSREPLAIPLEEGKYSCEDSIGKYIPVTSISETGRKMLTIRPRHTERQCTREWNGSYSR